MTETKTTIRTVQRTHVGDWFATRRKGFDLPIGHLRRDRYILECAMTRGKNDKVSSVFKVYGVYYAKDGTNTIEYLMRYKSQEEALKAIAYNGGPLELKYNRIKIRIATRSRE